MAYQQKAEDDAARRIADLEARVVDLEGQLALSEQRRVIAYAAEIGSARLAHRWRVPRL